MRHDRANDESVIPWEMRVPPGEPRIGSKGSGIPVDEGNVKKCFEESLEAAYEILRIHHLYYKEDEMDVWAYIKKYGYCDELFLKCIFPLALSIFNQQKD